MHQKKYLLKASVYPFEYIYIDLLLMRNLRLVHVVSEPLQLIFCNKRTIIYRHNIHILKTTGGVEGAQEIERGEREGEEDPIARQHY